MAGNRSPREWSFNAGLLSSVAALHAVRLWTFQAERHSGNRGKLFVFPPESRSPSTGFPSYERIETTYIYVEQESWPYLLWGEIDRIRTRKFFEERIGFAA